MKPLVVASRRCRHLPILLFAVFLVAGCSRPEASLRNAPTAPAITRLPVDAASAKVLAAEIGSAGLLPSPAPVRTVKPALRALIDNGWKPNAGLQLEMKALRTVYRGGQKINCYTIRFTSHEWQGKPVRIFGFYGYPSNLGGRRPALLLVHGGGGYATLDRVIEAGEAGFASLSIDLPGKGLQRERRSRSTGPDMTVEQIFKINPQLTDNYLYNAVLAQMRSITFLCSRPEVDAGRIGLVGVSWGGATGLITTSLDKRVKCFVDLYGAGYLRDGSTWCDYFKKLPQRDFDTWEANFDSSRYVQDITVPVLGVTGTNDNCYYLEQFLRTQSNIRPTPQLLLLPNLDHKINPQAKDAYYCWLRAQLLGKPSRPPVLNGLRVQATQRGIRMFVLPGGQVPVTGAEICYGMVGNVGWTNRRWQTVRCDVDAGKCWWSAEFALPSQVAYAFATVHFADGSMLSTPVHSLSRVVINNRAYALDVPRPYEGPVQTEAYQLAGLLGAQITHDTSAGKVALSLNGKEALLPAQKLGELLFVQLRPATEQLGGKISWKKGDGTSVRVPVARAQ